MTSSVNRRLFATARAVLAGGVNSPVRSFKALGRPPVFIARGSGKYLFGEDGRRYLDFCLSWGPLILGHAHPTVVAAVTAAAKRGMTFGTCIKAEAELASLVQKAFPSIQRVRFVSSGTEAVMSALRLARGFTGKSMILKFDGCYHGHVDALLVNAGSGVAGLARSSSAGVPLDVVRHTVSVPFNDARAFSRAVKRHARSLAAVIVEPVPGNMGVVLPEPGFLDLLRVETKRHGILLVFDEVITGFRSCFGGAQTVFGIEPDLTVLGKIIGGGMPVGAFGGRKDIMDRLAPEGDVYQAGTLSGNPLAMAAGIATLTWLEHTPQAYARMNDVVAWLADQWRAVSPWTINRWGSMFSVFAAREPVTDYAAARAQDSKVLARFICAALDKGIYLPPAPCETAFVSTRHTRADARQLIALSRSQ